MHSDEANFLAAIRADRDNDVIRGAYADWLDDHGGRPERAEFIRVQIALAGVPECPECDGDGYAIDYGPDEYPYEGWVCDCPAGPLSVRMHELLRVEVGFTMPPQTRHDWLGVPGWPWDVGAWHWRRGFIHTIFAPAQLWTQYGDDILKQHPVEVVRLTDYPGNEFGDLDLIGLPRTLGFTCPRWPGVRFEMPTLTLEARPLVANIRVASELVGGMFDELTRPLVLPHLPDPHLFDPPR